MVRGRKVGKPGHNFEEYLGDGAYVFATDWGDVVLYMSNGREETNRVVLDTYTLKQFEEWLERVRAESER